MTDWEESLFSLKESSFLNLLKNYVVDLTTPYNKQEMIKKLTQWLGKEEHLRPIMNRITEEEKTLLSVIHYLKGVSAEELPLDWKDQQKENLKERLLIFEKDRCYRITPLLEQSFKEEGIIDFFLFLDIRKQTDQGTPFFKPDDRLLMGFLSYFSVEQPFYLNDGSPRRRIIEELQEKIPYPVRWEDSFFGELAELFLRAGLLEKRGNNLILGPMEILDRFEDYSPRERILYLALLNGPVSSRGKLRYLLNHLKTLIPSGHVVTPMGWERILYLLNPSPSHKDLIRWKELPSRLSLLGLCTVEEGEIGFPVVQLQEEQEVQSLLVQPNGDIDLPPGTPFTASLVMSAVLEKGETFYRFRLTRESFEAGLRRGRHSARLREDLERLTGRELPGNLITNWQEWENQLHALRRVSGILLKVTGYPRRIINQIPDLESHIVEKIGDEWLLMREGTEKVWRALLKEVGLSPFEEHRLKTDFTQEDFPREEGVTLPERGEGKTTKKLPPGNKEGLADHLRSLNLPEEQEKEFLRRISRGVVLLPEQIDPSVIKTEIRKAGGLDFNSKLRQVSAALDSEYTHLEMKLPGKGEIRTVKAIPLELNNSREESQLRFLNEESGEEETVAVRKILEVIRFHGSLLS
ncbi:MAG: hypothetical protein PQJ60_08810 [Spirochaetales bacterium]|nr:hypothetical protein [Spirochaetales bacterium]